MNLSNYLNSPSSSLYKPETGDECGVVVDALPTSPAVVGDPLPPPPALSSVRHCHKSDDGLVDKFMSAKAAVLSRTSSRDCINKLLLELPPKLPKTPLFAPPPLPRNDDVLLPAEDM